MKVCKYFIFTLFLVCVSCGKSEKQQVKELYQNWEGREVLFPTNPVFTIMGRDTVAAPPMDTDYKILSYVDSVGCTSCKLDLLLWDDLIHEMDTLARGKVSVLFYMHPNNFYELRNILTRDNFLYPVCIDSDDRMNKLNHFPADSKYQTFLLDSSNRVVGIGDPVRYPAIKTLYLKKILGQYQ